jgi:hypothetical protein
MYWNIQHEPVTTLCYTGFERRVVELKPFRDALARIV